MFNSSKFSQAKFNRKSGDKGLVITANMHLYSQGACVVFRSMRAIAEMKLLSLVKGMIYRGMWSIKHMHLKGTASSYKEMYQSLLGRMRLSSSGVVTVFYLMAGKGAFKLGSLSKFHVKRDFKASGIFRLSATGKLIRILVTESFAEMSLREKVTMIRFFFVQGNADMKLSGEGEPYKTLECLELTLDGLNLMPGDELIIDSETMTVTVNGQNVLPLMKRGSEFIKLLPGANEIEFNGDGKASIFAVWKDRWL